ncbi:hypothetical protein OG21DRAFT_1527677 [Imleria badia]|nr:hypothetical protein OG21DRAFT_1527677 [Imleria badia]
MDQCHQVGPGEGDISLLDEINWARRWGDGPWLEGIKRARGGAMHLGSTGSSRPELSPRWGYALSLDRLEQAGGSHRLGMSSWPLVPPHRAGPRWGYAPSLDTLEPAGCELMALGAIPLSRPEMGFSRRRPGMSSWPSERSHRAGLRWGYVLLLDMLEPARDAFMALGATPSSRPEMGLCTTARQARASWEYVHGTQRNPIEQARDQAMHPRSTGMSRPDLQSPPSGPYQCFHRRLHGLLDGHCSPPAALHPFLTIIPMRIMQNPSPNLHLGPHCPSGWA